jgi:hypothetical protein
MRRAFRLLTAAAFLLVLGGSSSAQNNDEFLGPSNAQTRKPRVARPIPRLSDGRVNLGTPPGQKGHWIRTRREFAVEDDEKNLLPTDIKVGQIPFQPWAKELFAYRRLNTDRDSPHARCKPSAGPRQIQTAYGFEMVEFPELKQMIVFEIGGPHSYRIIHMDGRPHPANLEPSYYGHSTGRWEGDTLVVDTVGFNEKHWLDTLGLMHTDQYHQIERFIMLRWAEGNELFEYICQENNQNPEMVTGDDGAPLLRINSYTP